MKVFIMTDLEGSAGVLDRENWVLWESRFYEDAKMLLTNEINAAIEGLCDAGATEILVADGHGYGGINHIKLDERAKYLRGFPDPWPFGIDSSFDCICWVGQHAKASTEKAHICHTGNHFVINKTINGISIGEFGSMVYCAEELGVTPIFGSGDKAFCEEALDLVKGFEAVSVKEGLMTGKGQDLPLEETINRNIAAIHLHPNKACELIKEGAYNALKKYKKNKDSFVITKEIFAPYECIFNYRASKDSKAHSTIRKHESSIIKLFNSNPTRLNL